MVHRTLKTHLIADFREAFEPAVDDILYLQHTLQYERALILHEQTLDKISAWLQSKLAPDYCDSSKLVAQANGQRCYFAPAVDAFIALYEGAKLQKPDLSHNEPPRAYNNWELFGSALRNTPLIRSFMDRLIANPAAIAHSVS